MRSLLPSLSAVLLLAAGCATPKAAAPAPGPVATPAPAPSASADPLDPIAERYVKLVLAVGQHDPDYVDAYYGPRAWAEAAKQTKVPLADLRKEAAALHQAIAATPKPADALHAQRRSYLLHQLAAVDARLRMLQGEKLSFDGESEALYDAKAPVHGAADFDATLKALDALLPGQGALTDRLDAYLSQFVIPKDKLEPVFQAAIAEARKRTLAHVALPADETFKLEFVTHKPWGGYNWYQGHHTSLIQINTDLPIYPWRAIDLAAHEGYPGHHVYNTLLEQHLVKEHGWVEFTVYPLFSPQSLIAEGSANYGIEVAFPDAAAFARDVLFPLAGLDPAKAANYVKVQKLLEKLDFASNEAARGLLDHTLTRDQAREWLIKYALMTKPKADKRLDFIDKYRSYVINYNTGKELVREWVERNGGTADHPEQRWKMFKELLSSPRLPSDLR